MPRYTIFIPDEQDEQFNKLNKHFKNRSEASQVIYRSLTERIGSLSFCKVIMPDKTEGVVLQVNGIIIIYVFDDEIGYVPVHTMDLELFTHEYYIKKGVIYHVSLFSPDEPLPLKILALY